MVFHSFYIHIIHRRANNRDNNNPGILWRSPASTLCASQLCSGSSSKVCASQLCSGLRFCKWLVVCPPFEMKIAFWFRMIVCRWLALWGPLNIIFVASCVTCVPATWDEKLFLVFSLCHRLRLRWRMDVSFSNVAVSSTDPMGVVLECRYFYYLFSSQRDGSAGSGFMYGGPNW